MLEKIYISKKLTKVKFPLDTPWTTWCLYKKIVGADHEIFKL